MENIRKYLILSLILLFSLNIFISCKEGDGDPSVSFYTREGRLENDWKVTKINETVTYKTTTVTTTYDGSKKTVKIYVTDTSVFTPNGTLNYYQKYFTFTGAMNYSFKDDGSYEIDIAFADDTTGVSYTTKELGLWYFTGGNDQNGTSSEELLGLAPTKFVFNPLSANTYTYTYDGLNVMYIYHIYELTSDEVILRYNTTESTNLYTVTTAREMTLSL
jgi:hypothetical protein